MRAKLRITPGNHEMLWAAPMISAWRILDIALFGRMKLMLFYNDISFALPTLLDALFFSFTYKFVCDIIRKNLERHETNRNGRGDRAALTEDRR